MRQRARTFVWMWVLCACAALTVIATSNANSSPDSQQTKPVHKQQASKAKKKCKQQGKKHRCKKGRQRSVVVQVTPPAPQVVQSAPSSPCEAVIRNGKLISSSGNCALAVENDTSEQVPANPCIFVEGKCTVTHVCAKNAWHNAEKCDLTEYPISFIEHAGADEVCVSVRFQGVQVPSLDVQFRASKGSFAGSSEDPEPVYGLGRVWICNTTYVPPCSSAGDETALFSAFVYNKETGLYVEPDPVTIAIPANEEEVCVE